MRNSRKGFSFKDNGRCNCSKDDKQSLYGPMKKWQPLAKLGLWVDGDHDMGVWLGNGMFDRSYGLCRSMILRLPWLGVVEDFYPLDLGSMDVILGVKWLHELGDTRANWRTPTMSFEGRTSQITLQGNQGCYTERPTCGRWSVSCPSSVRGTSLVGELRRIGGYESTG